ncbi:flippase [Pedobacter cryophilus]|uniref:Flippase n=1 Tax=Pedobacter cryophilus TaxID=2571271 RepID=A0A4U1BY12_9SPHI|nr:flippase [Pedobacter cryophilus]TKB97896.1 flippase [Pedobacter cryophilus]
MEEKAKSNYWLKSGIINILQNMSGVLFGVGGFVFLVRILSPQHYGTWILFTTTTTIFSLVRDGMIRNALIKFLSSASDQDKPKILTAALVINLLISLFCVLLNLSLAHYLAKEWDNPEIENVFYVFNIVYIVNGILTQFNCIEQANLNFKGIFLTGFINQAIFFLYIFYCYIFKIELPLINLVLVQIVAVITSTVVAYFFVKDYLNFAKEISKEWIAKLFNYAKYSFGTSVSSILSGTVDKMMLGGIINSAAAGAYDIVIRIINLVDIPTNAMATIVFPQSAKRIETEGKDAIKYLYERSVGAILAILLPGVIFLYFFADFVIFILADGKFPEAVPMLKVTLIYIVLLPYGRQFGAILDSIGKTKITFYMVIFITVFNLVMNYVFIKNYGMIGAPYATLLANVVGFIIAQVILKRELNVNVINPFIYAYYFYPEMYKKFAEPIFAKFKNKKSE